MNYPLNLNYADNIALDRALSRVSLVDFTRLAWPTLEPSMPFVYGWHLDAIGEHLEAAASGEITRLLINVPPGTMKSMLTAVFFPAWLWGPMQLPQKRIIGASHEETLATRDTLKMRRLVESRWYQERWPLQLRHDQNEKRYYENGHTGFRQACAVKSMTGRRGDFVIWDDPHSTESALSDKDRATANRVFKETLTTRLNDPIKSVIIIVMQRLHEDDVSGTILAEDLGYTHLCLPMEYDSSRHCATSIGFSDPRTEEGELLFPERFPRETVERDKKVMGATAASGQFQQLPVPRGGGTFEWEKLEIVQSFPKLTQIVRYWDKAGTDDGGAYTAGVLMGRGIDGYFYVLDVVRGQWRAARREPIIKQTAELDGAGVPIWIEQEPGSGGKESSESTVMNLAGFAIRSERVTGSKEVRAEPFAVQVEAGNIKLLAAPWNKAYIDELKLFPLGKYKDQVDSSSGAFNKLNGDKTFGILL